MVGSVLHLLIATPMVVLSASENNELLAIYVNLVFVFQDVWFCF